MTPQPGWTGPQAGLRTGVRPSPHPSIHRDAVIALTRAFSEGGAVAVLDGEPGTGKSSVARQFLDALPPDTPRVMTAAPPRLKPAELFQAVLFDLGRPYQGLTEHELRLAVTGELLTAAEAGRRMVLLVDEAHHLTAEALEELRLLGNVESPRGPVLFVLLVGLPGVRDAVAANPSLALRVTARMRLDRLTPDESLAFLREQVRGDLLFAGDALRLAAEMAGGVPRVLKLLMSRSVAAATAEASEFVDVEAVLVAAEELGLARPSAPEPEVKPVAVPLAAEKPEDLPHPNQVPRPNRPLMPRHLGGSTATRRPTAA